MPGALASAAAAARRNRAPLLILVLCLAATATLYAAVDRAVRVEERARLGEVSARAADALHDRLEAYVATIRAARGLFRGGREPTTADLADFARAIEVERHEPGVRALGYAKLVRGPERAAHEAQVRSAGLPEYRIQPGGDREAYAPVVSIAFLDGKGQGGTGFDMLSEGARRAAFERSRDDGQVAASETLQLEQEEGARQQPGFLLCAPLFAREGGDLALRRAGIRGWIFASFQVADLVSLTLPARSLALIALEIEDGASAGPTIFRSSSMVGVATGSPESRVSLDVAGRTWTLRFIATPALLAGSRRWLPRAALLAGILFTVLLVRLAQGEASAAAEARRSALRARLLADASALLSSLEERSALKRLTALAAGSLADGCLVELLDPRGLVRFASGADPAAAAGAASLVQVPLRARDEVLGELTLVRTGSSRGFDAAERELALELARLTAMSVDTARLYRRAHEAVRLRDDFLSVASHELKTPLTSLLLQVEGLRMARERGNVPEPIARKAEVIRRNVERLARLVDSLLDLSRIGSGRLDLDLEPVDLAELAREVAARFEPELVRAGCTLSTVLEPGLVGRWDRLRVDQIVTNLLSNAVKYGAGHPIALELAVGGESAILTVRDGGIGIAADAHGRIFERFERAVSERHYGGFGLGLWIVRRLVESLGGTIRVESAPGQGATFFVELPLAGPSAQAEA